MPTGTVQLVSGEGNSGGVECVQVKRYFADRLSRVDVKRHTGGATDLRSLLDRLNDAGFVIR